jgi:hypothetical protein
MPSSTNNGTVAFRPFVLIDVNRREIGDYSITWKARFSKEGGSNITITAYARPGTLITEAGWMISQKTYDAAGSIIAVDYVDGISDFKNVYDNGDQNIITGLSSATPGVITYTSANYTDGDLDAVADGDIIEITGVVGATGANGLFYLVNNINTGAKTFELQTLAGVDVDTTGYGAYTSGGLLHKRTFSNYTYA